MLLFKSVLFFHLCTWFVVVVRWYVHRLTKEETADVRILFFMSKTDLSVKGKVSEMGGSNGDCYFLSKKRNIDPGISCRTSLGLRLPMYIYMNL